MSTNGYTITPEGAYRFDFADDVLNQRPDYISLPWTNATVEVRESAWASNGRALFIDPYGANGHFTAVFDSLASSRDMEILMRVRDNGTITGSHWLTGVANRISGTLATRTAVVGTTRSPNSGNESIVAAQLVNGVHTASYGTFTNQLSRLIRVRFVGPTVSIKVWADGAEEPADWIIEDHLYPSPPLDDDAGAGIFRFHGQPTSEVDWIEFTPIGAASENAIFRDNFERTEIGEDWIIPSEGWTIVNDQLRYSGSTRSIATLATTIPEPHLTNGWYVESRMSKSGNNGVGISAGMAFEDGYFTFIFPHLLQNNTFALGRVENVISDTDTGVYNPIDSASTTINNNQMYTLRLEVVGTTATMLVDGVEVASGDVGFTPGPSIGLRCVPSGNQVFLFDYIEVGYLNEPEADVKIMLCGDSITAGSTNTSVDQATYRMYLYDHLVDSGLVHGQDFDFVGPHSTHPASGYNYIRQGEWDHDSLSVSGWNIANLRDSIAANVMAYSPDILLVMIGINDIGSSGTPNITTIVNNFSTFIDNARAANSSIKILLSKISPRAVNRDQHVNALNDALEALASNKTTSESPIHLVDQNRGYINSVHNYDNLHPNALGEQRQAMRFADALYHYFDIGAYWVAPATLTLSNSSGYLQWQADPELADEYEIEKDGNIVDTTTSPAFNAMGQDGSYRVRGKRLI